MCVATAIHVELDGLVVRTFVVEAGEGLNEPRHGETAPRLSKALDQQIIGSSPIAGSSFPRGRDAMMIDETLDTLNGSHLRENFSRDQLRPFIDAIPALSRWASVDGPAEVVQPVLSVLYRPLGRRSLKSASATTHPLL